MATVAIPRVERSLTRKGIQIKRFPNNPLIIPDPNSSWMNVAVFNCGVIKDDDGRYKMLFRAASREDHQYSDIGLALSEDGKNWLIHDKPVLRSGFNQHCIKDIEDPRIVKWVDGWYYIFAGVKSDVFQIGIWRTKNFFEYEWVGIPLRRIEKNGAVFPELIGKYAFLLHRRYPHIWISRSEDVGLKNGWQDSQILIKAEELYPSLKTGINPRKIGMAAPPIQTPKGWLVLLYVCHYEDKRLYEEDKRFDKRFYKDKPLKVYSLGFAVLDLHDPTKVNYIHPEPILWPTEDYEIIGCVPEVCFCCAAVDAGKDAIYVYWGAADTVIAGGRLMKKDLIGICY